MKSAVNHHHHHNGLGNLSSRQQLNPSSAAFEHHLEVVGPVELGRPSLSESGRSSGSGALV